MLGFSRSFLLSSKTHTPKPTSSLTERGQSCLKMRVGNPIRTYSVRSLKCSSVSEDLFERSSPLEVILEPQLCFVIGCWNFQLCPLSFVLIASLVVEQYLRTSFIIGERLKLYVISCKVFAFLVELNEEVS